MIQHPSRSACRSSNAINRPSALTWVALAALLALSLGQLSAQVVPGRNVNMVAGTTWPDGDPFLQRQNEPSIAVSTRNVLHLLAGANDYRTVDLPGHPGDKPTADAWLGVFKSFDGGKTWTSTLIPGYPQDTSAAGTTSPLKAYDAAADPVVRAGANGLMAYAGIAFGHSAAIGAAPVQASLSDRTDRGRRSKTANRKRTTKKAAPRTSRTAEKAEKDAGHGGTKSAVFVSIFQDLNNRENGDPMPYVRTTIVDSDPGGRFLDKQWLGIDVPRPGAPTCTLLVPQQTGPSIQQSFAAGRIYIVYTAFTGSGQSLAGQILFSSSTDCGATWTVPKDISTIPDPDVDNDGVVTNADLNLVKASYGKRCGNAGFNPAVDTNGDCLVSLHDLAFVSRNVGKTYSTVRRVPQGATIAIDPLTGAVNVAWREFKAGGMPDAIRFARSTNGGATFTAPMTVTTFNPFDQGTTETSFRSSAFPTMVHDGARLYLGFSARGYASARPDPLIGDARVVVLTSPDGLTWSGPVAADDTPAPGHQIMPALAFGGGELWLLYYDLRQDVSQVFGPFVDELAILTTPPTPRHTVDVRIAHANPAVNPVFSSKQLSEYVTGVIPGSGSTTPVQLQYNPPNLPLFRQGAVPFMGDYIDLMTAPAMRPNSDGTWSFNIEPTSTDGGGHAVWTENRNVRVISAVQNQATGFISVPGYTPPNSSSRGAMSLYDSTTLLPPCDPDFTGTRNQDVYTARFDRGLFAVALGNAKPLGVVERGFALLVENATGEIRSYRLTVLNQPPGGNASFDQFSVAGNPRTVLDVAIPPLSTVARTVYVTSSDPDARVEIDVSEIAAPGDPAPIPGGRHGTIVLNPDPSTPPIQNPAIANPAIANTSILAEEIYTAKITPAIANPAIANPAIANPAIANPAIANVTPANPTVVVPAIANPAIANPAIANPAIANPAIANANLVNGSMSDVTWELSNEGNTAAAYAVKLLLNQALPPGFISQLVIHKTYTTPAADVDCTLKVQLHNVVVTNITNPAFSTPADLSNPAIANPAIANASVALSPGERASVTLRVFDPDRFDQVTFNAAASVTAAAVPQSVNSVDAQNGVTQPTPAVALTIITPFLNDALLGAGPYVQQFTANVPGTWAITAGALPTGLVLNPATGAITGTPSVAGTFAFTVTFTSAADPTQKIVRDYVIHIGGALAVVTNTLLQGQVGTPYLGQLTAIGGVGALRWAIVQGALPAGLVLDPATGVISGTPTANGTFDFQVAVSDSAVPRNTRTQALSITIGNFGPTDMAIGAITANPDPVNLGQTLTFNAVVTNMGPNDTDGAFVMWSLPPSTVLRPSIMCPQSGAVAFCWLGPMAPGVANQQHVSIEVTPQVGGVTLVTTARVISGIDLNGANNVASVSATAVGAGFRRVWSANSGTAAALTMIDPDTNAVVGTVQLGSPASDIAFSPDGTRAYVVQHAANNIAVVDARIDQGNQVIANIPIAAPVRAKVHPDGTQLYVTHGGSFVSAFDTATHAFIKSIPVGGDPHGLAFSPDGGSLFVVNRNSDSVSSIEVSGGTVVGTIPLPPGDFPVDIAVAPDFGHFYVTSYFGNSVTVFDVFGDTIAGRITVGAGPQGVAVSPDAKWVYVANFDDNTVSVIDAATNTVIATPVVPGSPNGIIVSPDGDRFFVTSYNANVVHVLSTTTNTIIGTIDVGSFPIYLDYARLP